MKLIALDEIYKNDSLLIYFCNKFDCLRCFKTLINNRDQIINEIGELDYVYLLRECMDNYCEIYNKKDFSIKVGTFLFYGNSLIHYIEKYKKDSGQYTNELFIKYISEIPYSIIEEYEVLQYKFIKIYYNVTFLIIYLELYKYIPFININNNKIKSIRNDLKEYNYDSEIFEINLIKYYSWFNENKNQLIDKYISYLKNNFDLENL